MAYSLEILTASSHGIVFNFEGVMEIVLVIIQPSVSSKEETKIALPYECVNIFELLLNAVRVLLEVVADDGLELSSTGCRGWRRCLTATETYDGRDGRVFQCLADKFCANKASRPSDDELHSDGTARSTQQSNVVAVCICLDNMAPKRCTRPFL